MFQEISSGLGIQIRESAADLAADSPYNYVPTQYVTIIFLVLFGFSVFLHTCQAIYFRLWWIFPTVILAGFIEVIGWSGRLWSSISPLLLPPFEMQITCTIIAPTPLLAANFIILGGVIRQLGTRYSRLSPRLYSIIFCSCDFISLVIQGVGGGLASTAAGNGKNPETGGHVMLGGIVFQMVTITVYVICATEFFVRYLKDTPVKKYSTGSETSEIGQIKEKYNRDGMDLKTKIMIGALVFSTVCLFIRAVYRTIELSDGWNGRIISTELYFNVLDGAMITLAIYTLNFAHPGFLLPKIHSEGKDDEKTLSSITETA